MGFIECRSWGEKGTEVEEKFKIQSSDNVGPKGGGLNLCTG